MDELFFRKLPLVNSDKFALGYKGTIKFPQGATHKQGDGMKKITVAFDVDGTLIRNDGPGDMDGGKPVANERIRSLLIALAAFKNTRIIVWSGGGELYVRQVCAALAIDKYVDEYHGKNLVGKNPDGSYKFEPGIKPDIAIDDIQSCDLGVFNLIVKEK